MDGKNAIPLLVAAGGGGLAYNSSSAILPYGRGFNTSLESQSGSTQPNGAGEYPNQMIGRPHFVYVFQYIYKMNKTKVPVHISYLQFSFFFVLLYLRMYRENENLFCIVWHDLHGNCLSLGDSSSVVPFFCTT
jgi:hypothetical protein